MVVRHNRTENEEGHTSQRLLCGGEVAADGARAGDPAGARSDQRWRLRLFSENDILGACVDGKGVGKGSPRPVGYNDSAGLLDGEHVLESVEDEKPRCAAADAGRGRE